MTHVSTLWCPVGLAKCGAETALQKPHQSGQQPAGKTYAKQLCHNAVALLAFSAKINKSRSPGGPG
jgi:hypothetical protein